MALHDDISQQPLTQVALWSLGEYGDLILAGQAEGVELANVSMSPSLPPSLPPSLTHSLTHSLFLSLTPTHFR